MSRRACKEQGDSSEVNVTSARQRSSQGRGCTIARGRGKLGTGGAAGAMGIRHGDRRCGQSAEMAVMSAAVQT
jgi:hypothetical protein